MEKAYESLSLFEFQQQISIDNQCLAYLSAEKWRNGYVCPKCGQYHYCFIRRHILFIFYTNKHVTN